MKKWILLVVLALLLGTGFFLYSRYREAASMKEFEARGEMTPREIREGILSDDPTLRLDAAERIGKLAAGAREAALIDALAADYAPTRLTALTVIASGGPPGDGLVTAVLDVAREDPDPDVRGAAFRALRSTGDPRVLDLALSTLDSIDAPLEAKLRAAKTLDELTGRSTADGLAEPIAEAEAAADELLLDWDEWMTGNRDRLRWDPAARRFVPNEERKGR